MPYVPSLKTQGKEDDRSSLNPHIEELAKAIAEVCKRHNYEAAFAGELNYCLTRLIQVLPRELVSAGQMKEEMRYWIQPLFYGVLLDVALEHKRRVNVSYEAEQIVKSGDCYDTPFYTKVVDVVDENGVHIGYQEIMVKRDSLTINKDILDGVIVLKKQ